MVSDRWQPAVVGRVAETAVLIGVLAIAALVSYTHLREVWLYAGAPWADLGPLTVDGLFAAAWLRMRRRRTAGQLVGVLAWLALLLAFIATLGGNLAAAHIAGRRDVLSFVVAAWPSLAFGLVWELVTGHGAQHPPVEQPLAALEPVITATPVAEPEPAPVEPAPPSPRRTVKPAAAASSHEAILDALKKLVDQGEPLPSANKIRETYNIGADKARALHATATQHAAPTLRLAQR